MSLREHLIRERTPIRTKIANYLVHLTEEDFREPTTWQDADVWASEYDERKRLGEVEDVYRPAWKQPVAVGQRAVHEANMWG